MENVKVELENVVPEAANFVSSIAEQGYKLETALADLVDNSIFAGADKVEILLDTKSSQFKLYIADNGSGMSDAELKRAMCFPSSSLDNTRSQNDLGRFGLGLKTASFSQTKNFTVISRTDIAKKFCGRTWDLKLLKQHGWKIKVEKQQETTNLFSDYERLRSHYLGEFEEPFEVKTLVVWQGLFKYENYINERNAEDVLISELSRVSNKYLSIVFHRFMERNQKPLKIRINNIQLKPFNPFPASSHGLRRLSQKNRVIEKDSIDVESFILPIRSIDEVQKGISTWVPEGNSLMDMEGIYLYRANRIILFGGWLGLAKRSQRMQLARMRIDIGNAVDHLIHLNVSKSQVEMPRDLSKGLSEQVNLLKSEAEREYLNRTVQKLSHDTPKKLQPLLTTLASNRGALMQVNSEFPILQSLEETLDQQQATKLSIIVKMFVKELNAIRKVHEPQNFLINDEDIIPIYQLTCVIEELLNNGFSENYIKDQVIQQMGYNFTSLPDEIKILLK